ncbi:MAG: carboxymuconolactone decarboxylase family protein [Agarilytica sp.]
MSKYTFHTLKNSSPEVKPILEQVKAKYGFEPNLFAYMAEAPSVLKAYLSMMDLIGQSSLSPATAHLAMLTASIENKCEFCTVAHHAIGKQMAKIKPQTLEALTEDRAIADDRDRAVVDIVREIIDSRGWVDEAKLQAFYDAGFAPQQYFELILTVAIKTLSNYVNHQTLPEANPELVQMLG